MGSVSVIENMIYTKDRQGRRYIILHKSGNDVLDTQLAQAFESWGYKVAANPGAFLVAWEGRMQHEEISMYLCNRIDYWIYR